MAKKVEQPVSDWVDWFGEPSPYTAEQQKTVDAAVAKALKGPAKSPPAAKKPSAVRRSS